MTYMKSLHFGLKIYIVCVYGHVRYVYVFLPVNIYVHRDIYVLHFTKYHPNHQFAATKSHFLGILKLIYCLQTGKTLKQNFLEAPSCILMLIPLSS